MPYLYLIYTLSMFYTWLIHAFFVTYSQLTQIYEQD
jgi:hypothetical protein